MESKLSQLYNKKEEERKRGEEDGKKGRKIMVFWVVTKTTLIRPFLQRNLFFKLFIFIGG